MDKLKHWWKYAIPFALGVLVFAFITQYDQTIHMLNSILGGIVFILGRFAIGFGMAYFLNFPMRFMERRLKFRRWLSFSLTYLLLAGILVLMWFVVVPALVDSAQQIRGLLPKYYLNAQKLVDDYFSTLTEANQVTLRNFISQASITITNYATDLLKVSYVSQFLEDFLRSFTNIAFGTLISMYALWTKEKIVLTIKQLLYALFPTHVGDTTLRISREAHKNFSQYIVGMVWVSVCVAILSFIVFIIFRIPIAPFLSVVALVCNMIPYFGPFMSGVITGVVLLVFGPMYALIGVLIVIVIQCIDGAIISPKILGDSVGISPLLTLISITVAGDLFGLLGIFLAVPVVGTLKHVVFDKFINARLSSHGLDLVAPDAHPAPPMPTSPRSNDKGDPPVA